MRDDLVVAVAQPPCTAFDVAGNADVHASTVRAARSRVVVFPELSLTGYELDAPVVSPDDPRLAPLVAACAATDSIALAGAPVDPGIWSPDGRLVVRAGRTPGEIARAILSG